MSSIQTEETARLHRERPTEKVHVALGRTNFVTVNNARICYRVFNPERTELPGILFVHGIFAHSHWWDHIVPYFQNAFRVAALDLSGMGNSESRTSYSCRGFANDILAVVQDADLSPVTIVAHSFGGTPTAFACYDRPQVIHRAVIIDSRMFVPGIPDPTADEVNFVRRRKKIYLSLEDALSRYRLLPSSNAIDARLLRHIATNGLVEFDGGWQWKFDDTLDPHLWNDPDRIVPKGIATPIDYIYGEDSEVISAQTVALIKAHLPNCSTPIAIPAANHHIPLEQPLVLVAALRSLFAREPRQLVT